MEPACWNSDIEQWLDQKFMLNRPYHSRQKVRSFLQAKGHEFIDTFLDPALQVTESRSGTGRLRTAALELFPDNHWGQRTALAVRLLQIGSPAVAIGQGGYGHSSEQCRTPKIESLGNAWSGLKFVLERMEHPEGEPMGQYTGPVLHGICARFPRHRVE